MSFVVEAVVVADWGLSVVAIEVGLNVVVLVNVVVVMVGFWVLVEIGLGRGVVAFGWVVVFGVKTFGLSVVFEVKVGFSDVVLGVGDLVEELLVVECVELVVVLVGVMKKRRHYL